MDSFKQTTITILKREIELGGFLEMERILLLLSCAILLISCGGEVRDSGEEVIATGATSSAETVAVTLS
jgi:hypothetical protein